MDDLQHGLSGGIVAIAMPNDKAEGPDGGEGLPVKCLHHDLAGNPAHVAGCPLAARPTPAPDSGLDVERLARALVSSDLIRRLEEYATVAHPETMLREPQAEVARSWARSIAAKYAASATREEGEDGRAK